jgi:hypothetical protein
MYPLKDWEKFRRGYTHGVKTTYSDKHLGVDIICPQGTELYAWTDCEVNGLVGNQGGNTAWVYADGYIFRFLHLKYRPENRKVKKGEVFALTGNTGLSSGPHVHVDVWSQKTGVSLKFADCIDPEEFFKKLNEEAMDKEFIKAIEALTGDDYGDNINENEQKRAAKDLRKVAKELEEREILMNKLADADWEIAKLRDELSKKPNEVIKEVVKYVQDPKLVKELEDTKAALEKGSAAYKILMDLKRAIESLLSFK